MEAEERRGGRERREERERERELFFLPAVPSEHGTLFVNYEEFAKEVKQ